MERTQVHVDEVVRVLVRMMPDGRIRPTSFIWRDNAHYVAEVGRQWEERVGGVSLRAFLIRSVDEKTFELRWNPAADEWRIHRAWLSSLV